MRDYHKSYYRPDNLCLIVTGQVTPEELFKSLGSFEERIASKVSGGIYATKGLHVPLEKGMQLVQPSKFFSVTIFRTRSIGARQYWHAHMGTWAMLLFLLTLKILMSVGVACPLL